MQGKHEKHIKNNTLFSCFQAPHPKKRHRIRPVSPKTKKTQDPWDWHIFTCNLVGFYVVNAQVNVGNRPVFLRDDPGFLQRSAPHQRNASRVSKPRLCWKVGKGNPRNPRIFWSNFHYNLIGFFESLGIHVTGFHWGFWIFHVTVFWIFHGCHVTKGWPLKVQTKTGANLGWIWGDLWKMLV